MERSPSNTTIAENKIEKTPVKEGVDFVFDQHPELASIGTKEQYAKYIGTIFPDSKFKEIVYHNSDAEFKNDRFKPMKPNFETLNSIEGVYNFSSNRMFIRRYGANTYAVVLDIHNPIEDSSSGEYSDDMDRPLSEALFRIGKQKDQNLVAPQYDESLRNSDAVVNRISGDGYVEKHPRTGEEWGIPKQVVVSVFNHYQIHILGSSSDMQRFKEFVERD